MVVPQSPYGAKWFATERESDAAFLALEEVAIPLRG
jgi:hypothetical protein